MSNIYGEFLKKSEIRNKRIYDLCMVPKGLSYREIAKDEGISHQRVRQIHAAYALKLAQERDRDKSAD